MPPFSGFLSKLVLAQAALAGENYFIVMIAVATSFFTLYSMIKIWSYVFWGAPSKQHKPLSYRGMMVPTGALVVFTVLMGIWAQPFLGLAQRAAATIVDPKEYIQVVMSIKQLRKPIHHPAAQPEHAMQVPHKTNLLAYDPAIKAGGN
jgi:multicomponent Na+:H+ antiporter subunit D